jgi:queuine tRNA-ribosyltransferase
MRLSVDIEAVDGAARTGTVRTARGEFRTPVFMPVGTRGTVRAVTTADMERLGAEVVLANAYHLMLRPGVEVVEALGGVGRFADWSGHTLTDSGGYQIFSLAPDVDDDGVTFRSTYDGSTHRVTPEDAVRIQEQLGADIQMVLDVCSPLPASRDELRVALDRTASWAARARAAHQRRDDQALFGIVQGGSDTELRAESADRTVALDFDGYAIGGLSVGETRGAMLDALDAALERLPADQPRYFMGLGDPVGLVEAVARGVDMMDCVLPTRLARHGTLLSDTGRVSIKRAEFARSDDPIDANCGCEVCGRYSRGYIRHLAVLGEPSAATLCTLHNLAWLLRLVERIRDAITVGELGALRSEVAEIWS